MVRNDPSASRLEPDSSSIEQALAAMARGGMVVVVDDEDRENEGDIIMAAEFATPEAMAFMVRWTSGVLCVALPPVPAAVDPSRYNTVVVWCETFGQFITAAKYRKSGGRRLTLPSRCSEGLPKPNPLS